MFNSRERHYTVPELAAIWNMSTDTVRRRFRNEPGVLIISNPRKGTRVFETLRIPESVAERVYIADHGKRLSQDTKLPPTTPSKVPPINHRPPKHGGAR